MTSPTASPDTSTDVLALANTPVLWVSALGIFLVIIVQTIAVVVQLGIVPMMPGLGYVATGICVLATILLTWFLRPRDRTRQTSPHTLHRTK